MDKLEKYGDQITALRIAMRGLQSQLWTAMPAIVQSADLVAGTCVVQPCVGALVRDESGQLSSANLPLLIECPIFWPGGGGATLTFPVTQGDECLVVFASRCIDAWWQSGGVQEQAELRMHDLSDGFAFVGFRSRPRALAAVSTGTAQLRSDDGETYVDLDPAGQIVKVKAPGGMVLDTPTVTVTGVMDIQNADSAPTAFAINGKTQFSGQVWANGKRIDETHTHNNVQPGSGNSGNVN